MMHWLLHIMLTMLILEGVVAVKENVMSTPERNVGQVASVFSSNSSISNIIDQEYENAFMSLSNPTLDIKVFTSASQIALLFTSLDVLSKSSLDASVENSKIQKVAQILSQFRGTMQNTGKGISDALRAVHQSMLAIQTNFDEVPELVTSLIASYKNLQDNGSKYLINLQMKNFVDIVKLCSDEAKKVVGSFDGTLGMIQNTANEGKGLIKLFDEQKRLLTEEIQRLYIEKEGIIEKRRVDYENLKNDPKTKGFWGEMSNYREKRVNEIEEAFKKSIADIDSRITNSENSNSELLRTETIVTEYSSQGVKVLGELQEQWIKLQHFFVSMQTVVVVPITRHMLTFDSIVQASHIKGSGNLGNQIITNGFKSVVLSVSLARTTNIYNEVSNKFVLPVLEESVKKQQLSTDAAKAAIDGIAQQMQSTAEECQRFIETKVREAKEKSINQMTKFRDEIKAAF